MPQLEVRRYNGTTYYNLTNDDYQLAKKWKTIDCGCVAYASARAALRPQLLAMIDRLTPTQPNPAEEKIRFIV
jgi:hypothetical protein